MSTSLALTCLTLMLWPLTLFPESCLASILELPVTSRSS
jgi:hypothetical protein